MDPEGAKNLAGESPPRDARSALMMAGFAFWVYETLVVLIPIKDKTPVTNTDWMKNFAVIGVPNSGRIVDASFLLSNGGIVSRLLPSAKQRRGRGARCEETAETGCARSDVAQ